MVGVVAAVGRGLLVNEVFFQVVHRRKVAEIPVAAGEGEFGPVVVAVVAIHLVPPVHVRIGVGILAAVEGEQFRFAVLGRQAVQRTGFVHEETVSICVGEFRRAEHGLETVLVPAGHLQRGILTALGGDGHDAVAALHTVQGRGCGILEDGNLVDFHADEVVHLTGQAVHQHERAVAMHAEGELQPGLVGVVHAGAVLHQETGELPVQGVGNVHFGALVKKVAAGHRVHMGLEVVGVAQRDGIQHGHFLRKDRGTGEQKRKKDICESFHHRVHFLVYQPGF